MIFSATRSRSLAAVFCAIMVWGHGLAATSEAEVLALWEERQWEDALEAIEEARLANDHAPNWDLLHALAYRFGLGLYRDTYEARKTAHTALLRGESRARVVLVDWLRETARADPEQLRKLAAMTLVLQRGSAGERHLKIGPFQFGPRAANARNLQFAFVENRRVALKSRAPWAFFNTSELAFHNERADPQTQMRQMQLWKQRAREAGAAALLHRTGFEFELGLGTEKDETRAIEAYTAAAAAGFRDSAWEMGRRYLKGNGVPVDPEQALSAMAFGAQGNPSRLGDLGELFHDGEHVAKDFPKAKEWYARAVSAGDAHSASELGRIWEHGWGGTEIDPRRAERYYRIAANRGSYWGKYHLGRILLDEASSPDEIREARFWLEEAAYDENEDAVFLLLEQFTGDPSKLGRDPEAARFWIRWAIALGSTPTVEKFFQTLINWSAPDWAEIRALVPRVTALSPRAGFLLQKILFDHADISDNDLAGFLRLCRQYADTLEVARRSLLAAAFRSKDPTAVLDQAEIQELFEACMDDVKSRSLLLGIIVTHPDLLTTPLAYLHQLAREAPPGSLWQSLAAELAEVETIDAAQQLVAEHFEFPSQTPPAGKYSLGDRDCLRLTTPRFPRALAHISLHDEVAVAFSIGADGTILNVEAVSGESRFLRKVVEAMVAQWKWEPAEDPEAPPFHARITIPISVQ